MISIDNISKYFGGQVIFDRVSFNVNKGEKIGLVGRNGTGKSTLFKLILDELEPDEGCIKIPKHYRIGALEQHLKFTKATILEETLQALPPEEYYNSYKAEKILTGLGFNPTQFSASPSSLSGGYQVRISLAKAILKNPDLLLLDEPTNYLDILSIRWLGRFLRSFEGEMIIITHDRMFMDSVITHTLGINRCKIRKIAGLTSKYYQQITLDESVYEQTRLNHEKKKKHLEQFITRFKAKASKATQAQSKIKQLEKMGKLDKLEDVENMNLQFQFTPCPAKLFLQVSKLSFAYADSFNFIFENLDLNVLKTDRIGIIGKNGKGKSTLLNVLAEELQPRAGHIKKHPAVKIGHFGQTNIQRLHLSNTVFQEVQNANLELSETKIRQICGAMLFSQDTAEKEIKLLSGGERSRVLLAKILAHKTNLLLLDEPNNHLDLESVEILGAELVNYAGAVIMVSHNEWLLDKVVNKLIVFQSGKVTCFEGSYTEFLQKVGWEEEARPRKQKPKKVVKKQDVQAIRKLKQEIQTIEAQITQAEQDLEANNDLLSRLYGNSDHLAKIKTLSKTNEELNQNIELLFERLEEKTEALEELNKSQI